MTRNLLYVHRTGTDDVSEHAIAAGWDVRIASRTADVAALLEATPFRVGILRFERADEREVADAEALLLATASVSWIALLDDQHLRIPRVARLVGEAFFDYHTLPVEPERLLSVAGHAHGMALLRTEFAPSGDHRHEGETEMVGASEAMQALFRDIRKLAKIDAPVFISGESGTGKELAAQAIHERSAYAGGPFVVVNCGALPPTLVQSELFGHEKGAFTGAHQRKIGRLEAANQGTIFLDEIGDLPLDQQVNLLRFLQQKTIERVGGHESIAVNARVLAATHVNLEEAVEKGRFREDLYYRLHVLYLKVPPLRQREGDVELLARYFFEKFSPDKNRAVRGFSQQALQVMNRYDWPGNVRELINRVRRAMIMSEHKMISATDLGLDQRRARRESLSLDEARARAERLAITQSMRMNGNNVSQAARQLGVSRVTLYRLLNQHELQPPDA